MKVDFFIVGAPKAGTTSLYHYLNQHPSIEMSRIKEPNFFSSTSIKESGTYYNSTIVDNYEDYHLLFNSKNKGVLFGEASVSYLFYNDVANKIKKYNPASRIIIVLRNPIERAFSHYLMDYRLGLVTQRFENIVNSFQENIGNKNYLYQQYIQSGKYSEQVLSYINKFRRDHVLIIDYNKFTQDKHKIVKDIYSFLEVDADYSADLTINYNKFMISSYRIVNWFYSIRFIRKIIAFLLPDSCISYIKNQFFIFDFKPDMSLHTREKLKNIFREDIIKLSNILNKDFTKWLK